MQKLTSEQQLVVNSDSQFNVTIAPAGSGKTFTSVSFIKQQGDVNVVAFTFTNKASNEIKERLGECSNVSVSTIHRFAYDTIKKYSDINYTMLSDSAQLALIQCELGGDKKLQSQINIWKSEALEPDLHKDYAQYEHICNKHHYIDFSSMATLATPLVQFRNKIDVLCVDEAQDLSQDQMNLINAIIKFHNPKVLLVGDPRQAIYGWRGGMKHPLEDFANKYNAKVFQLTYNFRSTKEICDLGNQITHLKQLKAVQAGLKGLQGEIAINCFPCADTERMQVVSRIRELKAIGGDSIAILFRTNHQMSRYEYPLIRACIPYEIWGGRKLIDHTEIKVLLAWLSLIADNDNKAAMFAASQSITGIGNVAAKKLTVETAQQETKKQPIIDFFDSYLLFLNEYNGTNTIPNTIEIIAETLGLSEPKLTRSGEVTDKEKKTAINRSTRVEVLMELSKGHKSISNFIEQLTMGFDSSEQGDVRKVVLSTIHKTKGLEFNSVFIPNMIQGNYPLSNSKGDIGDINEENNIVYVAATRPRHNLFISYSNDGEASQFIN